MGEQVHVVGTRPNFVKAAPVLAALAASGRRPRLVHTGQHADPVMSEVFFEQLGLPEPDLHLGVGREAGSPRIGLIMEALEEEVARLRPSSVVVYGDVDSTLAAALAAVRSRVPLAHVEAGLRCFDRSMPEEINRVVTDALASLHLVTSPEAVQHLESEGIAGDHVVMVGNPMIDTLLRLRGAFDPVAARAVHRVGDGPYGVVTIHRAANVDEPEAARRVVEALRGVAGRLPLVFPVHPRGRRALRDAGLDDVAGMTLADPLGYLEFMSLVSGASLVLTDSGGLQEETTILGVPCLTLRDSTERPITVTHGTNRVVGTEPAAVAAAAEEALGSAPPPETPPLWDGRAGERIAAVLGDGAW